MISSETPVRIDIGGVDEIDAGIDAEVDLPARLVEVGLADRRECVLAAKSHGAHGQRRDLQARNGRACGIPCQILAIALRRGCFEGCPGNLAFVG